MDNLTISNQSIEDADAISRINVTCWKESYKHIVESSFLEKLNIKSNTEIRKNLILQKRGIKLVAKLNDRIVGFSDAGMFFFKEKQILSTLQKSNRNELGEIYALYVDSEYQDKGIGQALFSETKNRLLKNELSPFLIWTFKENHKARIFYEKQGGIKVDEALIQIGEHQYEEVGYKFN